MKKSEINNYIRKYILPSHNQYYVDQYVMYQTFDNGFFIKGYLFYSKGDNEMGLRVSFFMMPLFVKKECLVTTIGEEILNIKSHGLFRKVKEVWWDTRKESQSSTFEKINNEINKQGEPILNAVNNANELCKRLKKDMKDNIRVYEVVAYSNILFANIEEQNKLLKGLITEAENERDADWVHQIKSDAEIILSTENHEGRINLLKSWANETIGYLKLPHIKPFEV
jgi:hypothetical protein